MLQPPGGGLMTDSFCSGLSVFMAGFSELK
jgi:hypothetical protein